ncbi:MAG TPA: hypothetical protein VG797_04560 [Phycisphaerales bacterium]|nr:hypothetical protein [Phycisphaerales bacterium]
MKTLLKIVAVLVVLVVVGVTVLFMYIDSIARKGIEVAATNALGVQTTLRSADVGIMAGTFDMQGLNVANPAGFQTAHFLNLGEGNVQVSLNTLSQQTVELPYLKLTAIDVNLEKKDGKSNYNVILDNVKKNESGGSSPSSPSDKKFVVREITIKDIKVHVDLLPIGGDAAKLDVPIDEIKLTNVGSGTDGGMLMKDLVPTIVKAVLAAVVQKGGDIIPKELLGDLEGSLAQLKSLESLGVGMTAELGKGIEGIAKGAGEAGKAVEQVGEGVKKAAEGLKDLIPGKKKD